MWLTNGLISYPPTPVPLFFPLILNFEFILKKKNHGCSFFGKSLSSLPVWRQVSFKSEAQLSWPGMKCWDHYEQPPGVTRTYARAQIRRSGARVCVCVCVSARRALLEWQQQKEPGRHLREGLIYSLPVVYDLQENRGGDRRFLADKVNHCDILQQCTQ